MSIYNPYYTPVFAGSKKKKKPKYAIDRVYASFWLDKGANDIFGRDLSNLGSGASVMVKAVKLRSYNRAVSNFVKILTNKEIPVNFHDGTTSFTDGKSITITSKIDTKNFDVVVGLALHEASHILLTDFNAIPTYTKRYSAINVDDANIALTDEFGAKVLNQAKDWKDLVNWIEDRRIDNFVFKASPGYKAYYHKLYDEYFNNAQIGKLLDAVDPINYPITMENYMFHIMNMTNSSYNKHAMKDLAVLTDMVDIANIGRLKDTTEVCELAYEMWKIMRLNCLQYEEAFPQPWVGVDGDPQDSQDSEEGEEEGESQDGIAGSGDGGNEDGRELTAEEEALLNRILSDQRKFVRHDFDKVKADRSLNKQLTKMGDMDVELESTFDGKFKTIVYNLTRDRKFWNLLADIKNTPDHDPTDTNKSYYMRRLEWSDSYADAFPNILQTPGRLKQPEKALVAAVEEGKMIGIQLGKKLRLVNETRELIHNRLKSGNIDKRRVACLGYDVETVFNQMHLDQYKGANLHISLDASGSMGGSKWESALRMTVAIAQAAATTQSKIAVQVSLRGTNGNEPEAVLFYDSKYNTIQNLIDGLLLCNLNAVTPEGLCFEALYKQNIFKSSNSELDSYLLNVSDGQPNMNGRNYSGTPAQHHTKQWIDKVRNNNIHILSYFVSDDNREATLDNCSDGRAFKMMYGKDARMVDSSSMIQLAKTLNDKFLAAKVSN